MKGLELANVSLRDFFALLVPGAVFLVLTPQGAALLKDGGLGPILAFSIAAYIFGAAASGAGSLLDHFVDPFLRSKSLRRGLFWKLERREKLAGKLKDRMLVKCLPEDAAEYAETCKSFWWDHLRLNSSPAIAELDRREAYQKLFRSLAVVLGVLALIPTDTCLPGAAINCVAKPLLWLASGAATATYAVGRGIFINALYRLAVSFTVKEC